MKKSKILLIDDDRDFVAALSVLLGNLEYEINSAVNSEEGYHKMKVFKPDLVILDVNMETDTAGFELFEKIRKEEELGSVPVIILTGIDTVLVSDKTIDMYHEMANIPGFKTDTVFKIIDLEGGVSVDYYTKKGSYYYLPLDCFIGKPVELSVLLHKIKRFLKE
jgi:CheY-like chemotaxis protein